MTQATTRHGSQAGRLCQLLLPLLLMLGPGALPAAAAAAGAVSAARAEAVDAGIAVLERGGSAMDAAVAVQAMLTVVEPQETGFGGGGFLLHLDGASGEMRVFDGREVAPAAASPDRFLLPGGVPMPFVTAVVSGRAVGVPGLAAMLHLAHQHHGRLPWNKLLAPAIDMARTGVPMPDRLRWQLRRDPSLWLFPDLHEPLLWPAWSGSSRLVNPPLAAWLERLAREGPVALHEGPTAKRIVERVNGRWWRPGDMTLADLANYRPQLREPVCGDYRQWRLCSVGPPSSGGVAILQMLGMLERFDLTELGPRSAEAVHLVAEASRLAFADRARYIADPEFEEVPVQALLAPAYLERRSQLIESGRARTDVTPGQPGPSGLRQARAPAPAQPERGTSHFSVVDADGNAVALTSSIEAPFGARMMVDGLLLNNQLTDFSLVPERDADPVANAVAPGKRPRSSMTPLMVFDADGELQAIVGSRGGGRIIGYVLKTLIGLLDWELDADAAAALPNFLHRGEVLELEAGTWLEEAAPQLRAWGHAVDVRDLESGVHLLQRIGDRWQGGADPRMEGEVRRAGR